MDFAKGVEMYFWKILFLSSSQLINLKKIWEVILSLPFSPTILHFVSLFGDSYVICFVRVDVPLEKIKMRKSGEIILAPLFVNGKKKKKCQNQRPKSIP